MIVIRPFFLLTANVMLVVGLSAASGEPRTGGGSREASAGVLACMTRRHDHGQAK